MTQSARITSGIINSDAIQSQTLRAIDAEDLDGRIEDGYAGDGRGDHVVRIEELRLLLSAIGTLAVPPACALAIEDGARGTGHSYIGSGDKDERARPFGVAEGCAAFENDLKYVVSELSLRRGRKGSLHECLWSVLSDQGSFLQARQHCLMLWLGSSSLLLLQTRPR